MSEPPIDPSDAEIQRDGAFLANVRANTRRLWQILIGGGVLAAIVGAVLTSWLTDPGHQGSITISAGGDVTVSAPVIGQQTIHGVPFEEYKAVLAERDITAESLGVTDKALAAFFAVLERERVPREALETTLKEIAERYRSLLARLDELPAKTNEEVASLKRRAREALAAVDFTAAEQLLDEAMALDIAAIERMAADLDTRKLSAAETASESGDLQMAQLAYAEAVRHYTTAVDLLPNSQRVRRGDFLNNLGVAAWRAGDYPTGMTALEEALTLAKQRPVADDHILAPRLNNLAILYRATGRYDDAEPLYERAITIGEKTLGPGHPTLAARLNNLALLYGATGRFDDAEPLYARAIAITEKTLGTDHPDLARWLNNLANLYLATGRFAEAEPLYERAMAISEKALGPNHPELGTSLSNLAALYHATGRHNEAEPLYHRAIAISEKALGPDHPNLAPGLSNLAALYHAIGRYDDAAPLYHRAIAIDEAALPPDHPHLAVGLEDYAKLLDTLDRRDEASALRARAQAIRDSRSAASN